MKHAHATLQQNKEAMWTSQEASQFFNSPDPIKNPAHAVFRRIEPVVPVFNEETARRKVVSIIDELVSSSDFKVGGNSGPYIIMMLLFVM